MYRHIYALFEYKWSSGSFSPSKNVIIIATTDTLCCTKLQYALCQLILTLHFKNDKIQLYYYPILIFCAKNSWICYCLHSKQTTGSQEVGEYVF